MVKLIVFILVVYSAPSRACFTFKPHQIVSPEELVGRTSQIVIAKMKSSKVMSTSKVGSRIDVAVNYTMEVIENLKGTKKADFIIGGHEFSYSDKNDFKGHSATVFWDNSFGRSKITPSCKISPGFETGKKYLVFVDEPFHIKSFELIESPEDKWLIKVREILTKKIRHNKVAKVLTRSRNMSKMK